MTAPSPPPHVGTVLASRYELRRHIARGGMGDVYEAHDRQLDRAVAVKLFRAAPRADRQRFDAEVRLLAVLNHPVLVRVYDVGSEHDDAFVVLELIDGPPLSERFADAPLSSEDVAELGADLADALAYIHERGVVHRDVTPSNVLCGPDGRARLVDFGIARLLESPRVTATAMTIGTASYMAPEQVEGRDVTPAADVYALGLVLLEALTGRREFTGSVHEVVAARVVRDPDTRTGVPHEWQGLLGRMCQRAPESRPTAAEATERIRAVVPSEATAAFPAVADARSVTAPITASGPTGAVTAPIATDARTDVFGVPPLLATADRSAGFAVRRSHAFVVAGLLALALLVAVGSALRGDAGDLIVGDTPSSSVPSDVLDADADQSDADQVDPSVPPTTTPTTASAPVSVVDDLPDNLDPRSPDFDPFSILPPGQQKKAERDDD